MRVWARCGDVEAEVTARGTYSPDVVADLSHRVAELVITLTAAEFLVLEDTTE